jgi:hypothetical protein
MDDPLIATEALIEFLDQSLFITKRGGIYEEYPTSATIELEEVCICEIAITRGAFGIDCQRSTSLT